MAVDNEHLKEERVVPERPPTLLEVQAHRARTLDAAVRNLQASLQDSLNVAVNLNVIIDQQQLQLEQDRRQYGIAIQELSKQIHELKTRNAELQNQLRNIDGNAELPIPVEAVVESNGVNNRKRK